jgi:cytochrome c-type biogenesis protein CcmE
MEQKESESKISGKRRSIFKRKRVLVAGFILLGAIAFLGYRGFQQSATYYLKVTEFTAKANAYSDKTVRINGIVETGSWQSEPKTFLQTFILTEAEQSQSPASLPVVYQGTVPDAFKEGAEVVVEGKYSNGTFWASNILTKCPSKYEPK